MALSKGSKDYQALLRTVVGEAVGEPKWGQIAVAWVIKNRADDSRSWWPNTIYDVCYQDGQFECLEPKRAPALDRLMRQDKAAEIDKWLPKVYVKYEDPTEGGNHYYAFKGENKIIGGPPDWMCPCEQTYEIENHRFYRIDNPRRGHTPWGWLDCKLGRLFDS